MTQQSTLITTTRKTQISIFWSITSHCEVGKILPLHNYICLFILRSKFKENDDDQANGAVSIFFFADESFMCLTKHEPVGVCGAIIPVSPEKVWFEFMSNNVPRNRNSYYCSYFFGSV